METLGLLVFLVLLGLGAYAYGELKEEKERNLRASEARQQATEEEAERQEREFTKQQKLARAKHIQEWISSEVKEWENEGIRLVELHRHDLRMEKKRLTKTRLYGIVDAEIWLEDGIPVFVEAVLLPSLSERLCSKYDTVNINEITAYKDDQWIDHELHHSRFDPCPEWIRPEDYSFLPSIGFEEALCQWSSHVIDWVLDNSPMEGFEENMSGEEFELFCKSILDRSGWTVQLTPTTGDQGIDLIASLREYRVCIQCKRLSSSVGNSAVQEAVAGRIHWEGSHAAVVTNSVYTKSAQRLAKSAQVLLVHYSQLESLESLLDEA